MIAIVGLTYTLALALSHQAYMESHIFFLFYFLCRSFNSLHSKPILTSNMKLNRVRSSARRGMCFFPISFIAPRWMTLTMTWLMIIRTGWWWSRWWWCDFVLKWPSFKKSFNRRQFSIVHSNTLTLSRPALFHSRNSTSFFFIVLSKTIAVSI